MLQVSLGQCQTQLSIGQCQFQFSFFVSFLGLLLRYRFQAIVTLAYLSLSFAPWSEGGCLSSAKLKCWERENSETLVHSNTNSRAKERPLEIESYLILHHLKDNTTGNYRLRGSEAGVRDLPAQVRCGYHCRYVVDTTDTLYHVAY
jgi:hypothetical protein